MPAMLTAHGIRLEFAPASGAVDEFRFWGSAWRGAMGHALKRHACLFDPRHSRCERCVLSDGCAYARLFPESTQPRARHGRVAPFTMFAEWTGGGMRVEVVLFGDAAAHWKGVAAKSLVDAGRRGVGGVRFAHLRTELLAPEREAPAGRWRVRMRSPLRCKANGRLVGPSEITPQVWFGALVRRVLALGEACGALPAARRLVDGARMPGWSGASWRWKELERYSRRQKAPMRIGGLLGAFEVEADERLARLLAFGRWTHAGKLASMGLGRYEWEIEDQGGRA
ncbi:MAG: CRISPR system precrRNA processing endoribonuclease RAMP protein Cas6 [Zetaproteobacteria bacterium]|nr:MAG: CRISPR system precrRNA processing endoribonuclease RAMP protein Cas6 [Zetaproteobacteria bacterium]